MNDMALTGALDAVFTAQANFRAIMDALARPGTIQPLTLQASAGGLDASLAAVALTLVDHETPVWLSPALATDKSAYDWLAFATGAPLVDAPERAAFALVADVDGLPDFRQFAQGTQDYPDRSATIVKACSGLSGAQQLVFEGPGIPSQVQAAPADLGDDFVERWVQNRAHFPLGVDLILCSDGSVMGLPRTLTVKRVEA